ncbi:hypothetical protein Tco_1490191 [Tanacetum coccineum]
MFQVIFHHSDLSEPEPEPEDQIMQDAELNADENQLSDSKLSVMPDDDIQSSSGYELFAIDNEEADAHSEHHFDANNKDNAHASAKITVDLQGLHDHLDHVCEEVTLLNYTVANIETSVTSKVSEDITSSVPTMINSASKDQLPGLLSEALKECMPNILKETLQT